MNQGSFRNFNNPYQNSQISPQPYQNNQYMQMNIVPPNPFLMNQPMRNQPSGGQNPPSFHRSHTWHGNDLSSGQHERDRDERRGQERDRYTHRENRDRDRSSSRRRDGNSDDGGYEDYRNSPSGYNRNGNNGNSNYRDKSFENIESRRQKVLQKHDRMLQSYRREKDSRSSPPYHSHKRGRY